VPAITDASAEAPIVVRPGQATEVAGIPRDNLTNETEERAWLARTGQDNYKTRWCRSE